MFVIVNRTSGLWFGIFPSKEEAEKQLSQRPDKDDCTVCTETEAALWYGM